MQLPGAAAAAERGGSDLLSAGTAADRAARRRGGMPCPGRAPTGSPPSSGLFALFLTGWYSSLAKLVNH